MKVLFVTELAEDFNIFRHILYNKFPKIELLHITSVDQAMNEASSNGPFAAFIIDADMKEIDPNALGLNLIEFTGPRPVLFFGTEAIIKQRIGDDLFNVHELNDTVFRPTEREGFNIELINKFEKALTWMKEQEREEAIEEVNADDFIPMKIKSFFLYRQFPYDIYLAITAKSYMRVINADKPYSHNMLTSYAKKNIKFLHIKKDDQLKFLEEESKKCLKALKNIDPVSKDVYLILLRSITIMHQYMMALGVTPSVFKLSEAITDIAIEHLKLVNDIPSILKKYPTFYTGVASKSLLTLFLAKALSLKMGWDSITSKKKLAICALLQDVALPEDSMSAINSTNDHQFKLMSPQLQNEYLKHPQKASDFSKQFSTYSDIDYIIELHHELPNRKGFPNRPPAMKLTQIVAVFNISQYLAAEVDGRDDLSSATLSKIFKSMQKDFNLGSFKEVLKGVKSILKI